MKKTLFFALFLALTPLVAAEEKTNRFRIPHTFSFETGWRMNFPNEFSNLPAHGVFGAFEYAWQLSGFEPGRPAAYLGLPMRFTSFLDGQTPFAKSVMFNYGWSVRHQLAGGPVRPFFGYNLLLSSFTPDNFSGYTNGTSTTHTPYRVFGHETKFDFGLDFIATKSEKGMTPAGRIQISGSLTSYPELTRASRSVYAVYASACFWLL